MMQRGRHEHVLFFSVFIFFQGQVDFLLQVEAKRPLRKTMLLLLCNCLLKMFIVVRERSSDQYLEMKFQTLNNNLQWLVCQKATDTLKKTNFQNKMV
jgi:hypothetical protein